LQRTQLQAEILMEIQSVMQCIKHGMISGKHPQVTTMQLRHNS